MVRQLAAFTNVWRWHVAQGDRVNIGKTALNICHDTVNYVIIMTYKMFHELKEYPSSFFKPALHFVAT